MKWAWIKQFPKFALVIAVLVLSTGLFGYWWITREAKRTTRDRPTSPVEDIGPKLALIESKPGHLLLVDNDLYDIDTGTVIFRNWLKEGPPLKVLYDDRSKKIMARYERGFIRYALEGKTEVTLSQKLPPLFSTDLKSALFVKDKDLWRAEVNWQDLKLETEKKITSIEQFYEQNFAANVLLRTEKTLVVRNLNQILRVNLETGEVHPTKIRLDDMGNRRSPDSKWLVGTDRGQFYCYSVDSEETKSVPIGRGAINDFQWLANDRCVAIASMKAVVLYDRTKNTLTEIAPLPFQCLKIAEPSPDFRFLFCLGRGAGALVDLQKKIAMPVTGGAGVRWVSNDTFAFSREVADSTLRGTWLQTVSEGERRISSEPYLVGNGGGFIMSLPSAGMDVFVTKHGVSKMKADGTACVEILKLPRPPTRLLQILAWPADSTNVQNSADESSLN
jgi:hypothetical protein